jgi:catalase
LGPETPRETPTKGFATAAATDSGPKARLRSESFADHYSQARLFYRSQQPVEQTHIAAALVFELSKVETPAIRTRMVSHLRNIDETLAERVANALGMELPEAPTPIVAAIDLPPSPALSILEKAKGILEGRMIGCLVSDGADGALIKALQTEAKAAGAKVKLIAPSIGGVKSANGGHLPADFIIDGGPSILFDAVAVLISNDAVEALSGDASALNFIRDAFAHLKFIAFNKPADALLAVAGVAAAQRDKGVIATNGAKDIKKFLDAARALRLWQREPSVKRPI